MHLPALNLQQRETLEAYLFLLPAFVGLLLFSAGAVILAFGISFCRWTVFNPPTWIGLENYLRILREPLSKRILGNTLYYVGLMVPACTLASLGSAVLMNRRLKGIVALRSVYFLPVIISAVAMSLCWKWIYHPTLGLLNHLLKGLGLKGTAWLANRTWAMPSIIIMGIWKDVGYYMVLFLAGLQSIPVELHEAARIDGAGAWQRFRYVTLPLLAPITFFVVVIAVISSFQVFTQTFIMTEGGPAQSTLTIALHVYYAGLRFYDMGYASAWAYLLFIIILVVTFIQFKVRGSWTLYEV